MNLTITFWRHVQWPSSTSLSVSFLCSNNAMIMEKEDNGHRFFKTNKGDLNYETELHTVRGPEDGTTGLLYVHFLANVIYDVKGSS
jgi:hypothetical protein